MRHEQILKQMEKVFGRLEIYDKKKQSMGLDSNELKKYCELYIDYLELKLQLWDDIFMSYILPETLRGEVKELYNNVCKSLKWKGNLLVAQTEIDLIIEAYAGISNKKQFNKLLKELYSKLKVSLLEYSEKLRERDLLDEICLLMSNGESRDFEIVQDFLDYKFEVLYMILEIKEEFKGAQA